MIKADVRGFRILAYPMKFILLMIALVSVFNEDYILAVASGIAFLVTLTPQIIEREKGIVIPAFIDFAGTLALFLHILGWALQLYYIIPNYDKVLHLYSSMIVGLIAFMAFYLMGKNSKKFCVSPILMVLFSAMIVLVLGVAWEVMEFTMDQTFNTTEQWGLEDTMFDLIMDGLGAILFAILGLISFKTGSFQRMMKEMDDSIDAEAEIRKNAQPMNDVYHVGNH